jgi:hypothetical protein
MPDSKPATSQDSPFYLILNRVPNGNRDVVFQMELDHLGSPQAPKQGKLVVPGYEVAGLGDWVRAAMGRKKT